MRAFEASQYFFDVAAEHLEIYANLSEAVLMPHAVRDNLDI